MFKSVVQNNYLSEIICDRCNKKCEDGTCYTVNIYRYDINSPYNFNWRNKVFGTGRHYCKSFRDKIEKFLRGEESEKTT